MDLRKDEMSLQRLKDAAERAKIELSTMKETKVGLPFIYTKESGEALHLQTTITKEQFEELVADLVHRSIKICQATLQEAGLDVEDIDDVILVGGMTRMPKIQEAVAEFFQREPSKAVHPDEAVALGAAIQGSALSDNRQDVLLLDVTPHSLGIMVHGGGFERLIEANTTIPTAHAHTFTTVRENQTAVKIIVFQGENEMAAENELLGEFVMKGLRPAPAGEVEIQVEFNISADGIVSVKALDLETGKEQSITVTATSGLTEDEIKGMIDENQDYLMALKEDEEIEIERNRLNKMIREVEKHLDRLDAQGDQMDVETQDACDSARVAVSEARNALSSRDFELVMASVSSLERARAVLKAIA